MACEACAFWLLTGCLVCLFFLFCPLCSELQPQNTFLCRFTPGPLPWLVLCLEACFPAVNTANCLASQRPLSRYQPPRGDCPEPLTETAWTLPPRPACFSLPAGSFFFRACRRGRCCKWAWVSLISRLSPSTRPVSSLRAGFRLACLPTRAKDCLPRDSSVVGIHCVRE